MDDNVKYSPVSGAELKGKEGLVYGHMKIVGIVV